MGERHGENEVRAAVAALSGRELLRLRQFGRALLFGEVLGLDAEGLVHEALARALNGSRSWPQGQRFDVFVKGAMKSIASEYVEKREGRLEDLDGMPVDEDGATGTMDRHASALATPQRRILWDETEAQVLALFEGKPAALYVLKALLSGLSPSEICERSGLDQTAYESARKAIYREKARLHTLLGLKENA